MDTRNALRRGLERLDRLVVDGVLALALAAVALVEIAVSSEGVDASDIAWSVAFAAAITLPLALRRRYPFAVMAVVGSAAIVYNAIDVPPDPYTLTFAVLLALYTASAYASRRLAIAAGVVTLIVQIVLNLPGLAEEETFADDVNQVVLLGGAWVVGQNTRYRRRQAELLEERAERVERERAELERIAVLEERGRLAREIHDVIAHSVGVIAVQAGAARAVAEQRPDRAREALGAIEEVSKDTLVELRRTLGALRGPSDEAALAPAPGLDRLGELVEQVGRAGVSVSVSEEGDRIDLPPGVDLSAFRVVQEALTNTVKHAGQTAAHVSIRSGAGWLEVAVTDDGGPRAGDGGNGATGDAVMGAGQGLIGMRERVTMLGGEFEAGRRGSGFAVRARFPIGATGEAS
jgi:signal transduction histidine kinase